MGKITSKLALNRLFFFSFLTLCSLFISENAFSRNHWNQSFVRIKYNLPQNAIYIQFEFFDYHFGPANENGFLEYATFEYSTDEGKTFSCLMKASTPDQKRDNYSWLYLTDKLVGAKISYDTYPYNPKYAQWRNWLDNTNMMPNIVHGSDVTQAWITTKWELGEDFQNITNIRVYGKWHHNGVWPDENFDENYSDIMPSIPYMEKSSNLAVDKAESDGLEMKVFGEADAIIIKGANLSHNIKVYTTSGEEVKSIIPKSDVVKVELPTNKVYIVNVGQASYKVAL